MCSADAAVPAGRPGPEYGGLGRRIPLVFFPEGTCSVGDTVLPFRSGLLGEAIAAGQPITAAYLRYRLTQDNGPNRSLTDVCFWDDTPLIEAHLPHDLDARNRSRDRFADAPIAFTVGADQRKLAAQQAHAAVMELRDAAQAEPVALCESMSTSLF